MPSQKPTRTHIRRLRKATIRLASLRGLLCGSIRRRIGSEAISAEFAIEVDFDGADVRGANGGEAEEAPAPAAEQHDALVEGEEPGKGALQVGGDAVEFAGEVAALLGDPGGGGVEAVVVAGGEVDDDVVESVGRFFGFRGKPGLAPDVAEGEVGAHFGFGGGFRGCGCVHCWGVGLAFGAGE